MSERAFKDSKAFLDKFNEYLKDCDGKKYMPNVAGFCSFANINRDTFYAQKDYYSDTFNKINYELENEAINTNYVSDTMKIFYMKNKCGYRDKQEIESNVNLTYEDKLKEMTGKDEY